MKTNIDLKNVKDNKIENKVNNKLDNSFNKNSDNILDKNNDNSIDGKKWVWILCKKKVYKAGYIISEEGNTTKVQSDIVEDVLTSDIYKMNPTKYEQTEDLAALSYLNEYSVLYNLETRYASKQIYTYSGLFLVALNPYHALNIYSDDVKKRIIESSYRSRGMISKKDVINNNSASNPNIKYPITISACSTQLAPHIFAVANEAYQSMVADQRNQSILITGESGAGKTENTKRVIEFLTYAVDGEDGRNGFNIKQTLVSTNVILEAFGNAKTVKNDNSSRFGRFIQIKFRDNQICGAKIEKYLLEKSRVVGPGPGERNFHIFYYLIHGLSDEEQIGFGLSRKIDDYACLRNSAAMPRGFDEASEFSRVQEAFLKLGVTETQLLYKAVALVLHLSNLEFIDCADGGCCVADIEKIQRVCDLLGTSKEPFLRAIVEPVIHAGREDVVGRRGAASARAVVEGLMKTVYEWLFDRLISTINSQLDSKFDTYIGVLDIAGFEILENNSFEQLCINYTNEKLQQYFNQHMFVLEQERYRNEQIRWDFLDFGVDLEPTIALIESTYPIGILSYIEEECVMPGANDTTLLEKIHTVTGVESVPFKNSFSIRHYAGRVEYNVDGWIRKNKDTESEELFGLIVEGMCGTNNNDLNIISDINYNINNIRSINLKNNLQTHNLTGTTTRVKKGVFKTVSQSHRESLNWLLRRLRETQPHFVRCILPNTHKHRDEFDRAVVLDQLRCNGVLEGIRISRLGYPSRLLFAEFNNRYTVLIENSDKDNISENISNTNVDSIDNSTILPREETLKLLVYLRIPETQYRVGRTTVFFRQGVLGELEDLRDKKIHAMALSIQRLLRSKLEMRRAGLNDERLVGVKRLQCDARACLELIRSRWWALFLKIQPLLDVKQVENERRRCAEELLIAKKEVEAAQRETAQYTSIISAHEVTLQDLRCELAQRDAERIEASELSQRLMVEKKELSESIVTEMMKVAEEKKNLLLELIEIKKQNEEENKIFEMEKNKQNKIQETLESELEMLRGCERNHFERQQQLEKALAEKGEAVKCNGSEIEKYKDMVQTLECNYHTLQDNNKILQDKYKISIEDMKIFQDKYKLLEDKYKILIDNNKTIKDNLNLLQDNYSTLECNYKVLQDNYNTLRQQFTQCKEDLQVANDRLSDMDSANERIKEQHEHRVSNLEQELGYQRERNNKLQKLFADLKAMRNITPTIETEQLVPSVIDNKVVIKLRNRLTVSEKMINELRREKEILYAENLELTQNKLNEIFASENEANKAKAILSNEIRRLEQENRGLRNELSVLNPSGSECSDETGYERLLLIVEEERKQRIDISKRVIELESIKLVLENELSIAREAIVVSDNKELLMKHVTNLISDLDKMRKSLRRVIEVFGNRFMILFEKISFEYTELRTEWISDKEKLFETISRNDELTRRLDDAILVKDRVLGDLIKCRTENEAGQLAIINVRELRQHIEKLEIKYSERENEITTIRSKYNEAVHVYVEATKDYEAKSEELRIKLINRDWMKLDNELTRVRNECKIRISKMATELETFRNTNDELITEVAKKTNELCQLKDFISENIGFKRIVPEIHDDDLVREHLISTFIVDKDALKTNEWKTIIDSKCTKCQDMVVSDNSELCESLLKKSQDIEILSLRLKQAERDILENNKIIETLKLCLTASYKK